MPELPEVEIVRRGLERQRDSLSEIREIRAYRKDLRYPFPLAFFKQLKGAHITAIERRAKYLIFRTNKGDFLSHLGMTGTWRVETGDLSQKHDHLAIIFDGCSWVYNDPRLFGFIKKFSQKEFAHLGPEPFSSQFSAEYLLQQCQNREMAIKVLLMNQQVVVGVGNIYASEALFLAKTSPLKKARRISFNQAKNIVYGIQHTLSKSIERGGSSISDFKQIDGSYGGFQNDFLVYGRGGRNCGQCGAVIQSQVQFGRSSFWCKVCQK